MADQNETHRSRDTSPAKTKPDTAPPEESESVSKDSWELTQARLFNALKHSANVQKMSSGRKQEAAGMNEVQGQESTALTLELLEALSELAARREQSLPPALRPRTREERKEFFLRILAEIAENTKRESRQKN